MSIRRARLRHSPAMGSIAVALFAAACGMAPAPLADLRVGVIGTTDELPYFVMEQQGLDRKHGLAFRPFAYAGGAPIIDALAAGTIDVSSSVGTVPLLNAAERGIVPARVIPIAGNNVADIDHPNVGMVVAPSIRGWRDLVGKFIAVPLVNSVAGAASIGRLRREGVTGYRLVTVPIANLGLALASGDVQGAAMTEPFLTQALLRGDGKLLGWIIGGPPLERMVFSVTVVRSDLYRGQPDVVKRLLRAYLEAVDWIDRHPAAARSIVATRLGITEELGQKIHLLRWPRDARVDPVLFESMQGALREADVIKAVVPARRLFDETLLGAVLAEGRR